MRDRTADKRHVLHSGQSNIGNELPAAAQQAIVLLSGEASSDAL
jgi:hypothetical protein